MRVHTFRFTTILFFIISPYLYSQSDIHRVSMTFRLSERDTVVLQSFERGSITYVPLDSLLYHLQMPAIVNDTTKRIEFLAGTFLVRFTAKSPFVVFTDRKTNASNVYQMLFDALRKDNIFFVPIQNLIPLLFQIADKKLTYQADLRLLSLQSPVQQFDITGLKIERKLNGYLLNIQTTRQLEDVETWLKPDGWLFVTIANATADTIALQKIQPYGVVRKILTFQSPTSLQLTFHLSPDVEQAEASNDPNSNNLLISLRTKSQAESKEVEKKRKELIQANLAKERNRWKLDVIVIDAGHGGKDPGTIGVRGTLEKDITLAVALKFGKLIEKNLKDVKVIYTRKTDTFIELYKRTQIANEASGKLFVSIHCNSMEKKPSSMNGFEIYLLKPGRTEDAIEIASKENAVIQFEEGYKERYKKLTEEEFIIITMAQSAYMKHSEQFATVAAETMSDQLKIKNSGVKQAGFYVLVGASMPNVLVELGYLSNRKEEQVLRSQSGQQRIAEALYKSIIKYKTDYEKALQEGVSDKK